MPSQTDSPRITSTSAQTRRNLNNKPNQSLTELLTNCRKNKDGGINKDEVKEGRKGIAKQREKDQKEELQKILTVKNFGYTRKR